jgi:CBS-domain-containing membrane protein
MAMTRATIAHSAGLVLKAQIAEELMIPNPPSLSAEATIPEAIALLTNRAISAAPVIDEAGHPVGVLSRSDLLIHDRESSSHPLRTSGAKEPMRVRDIMTPAVFTVSTNAPATEVVKRISEFNVHQLFVVDEHNVLVGVITALDIVGRLAREV